MAIRSTPDHQVADHVGAVPIAAVLAFLCAPAAAISSSLGSILIAGQTIYPFKVIVPALVIVVAPTAFGLLRRPSSYPGLLALFSIWGALGLIWAANRPAAVKELSILVFAALVTAGLVSVTQYDAGTRALLRGWLAAGWLTSLIAGWELVTGQHLDSVFVEDRLGETSGVVLSTFGNPNNYGAFILLTVPFVAIVASGWAALWGLGRRDVVAARLLCIVLPALLLLSGSRLAVVGMAAGIGTFLLLNRRHRLAGRVARISAVGVGALLIGAFATGQEIAAKFSTLFYTAPFTQTSGQARLNLTLNGLDFLAQTYGVGLGAGGFEAKMSSGRFNFPVQAEVVNPHNFWIEVASQYGLVGIGLITLVFVGPIAVYARAREPYSSAVTRQIAAVLLAGAISYLFATLAGSSYVNAPENWMFLATFAALTLPVARSQGNDAQLIAEPAEDPQLARSSR